MNDLLLSVLVSVLVSLLIICLYKNEKESYKPAFSRNYKRNPTINTYCFKSNDCPSGMCCVDDNKYDNPTCQPCLEECKFFPSPSNTLCVPGLGPRNVIET